MEVKKIREGSALTIMPVGRLDAVTAVDFDKEVTSALEGVTDLTIDLKELNYIASAGLRVLLKIQKRMTKQGTMIVKNIKKEVRTVLDMTGFSNLLNLEESKSAFSAF